MQYLPLRLIDEPKVLVIGSGGGRDVLAAFVSGSKEVVAVEVNPIILEVVNQYGPRAGNIYRHPYVRAYVDEGRGFVARSTERFDVIYISLVGTWAAVSSGGLSLSENYLYTVEAFKEYYDHLTERGIIVVVRWLLDAPRLISTFIKLLEDKGIPRGEAYGHLVVATERSVERDPSVTAVVFSKKPLSDSQINFLESSFKFHGYKPISLPDRIMLYPYDKFLKGQMSDEEFASHFEQRVRTATDDSPYFLSFEKPCLQL